MKILKTIIIADNPSFYFGFDTINDLGLCYDRGFNEHDTRNAGWEQIRTYI